MKKFLILFLFFILADTGTSFSQTYESIYRKGLQSKAEYKYIEALALFQVLLKTDSNKIDYLNPASILFSKAGNLQPSIAMKKEYFSKALYLAKKAVTIDPQSAEAHYALALALGRINENASSKEKIANAKMIKTEAETAVKLDPNYGGAYHILGRWHRTIADFGMVEKLAINTMFGGVPEGGSLEASIEAFKNAIRCEPDYILHYYELAVTYHERNAGASDKKNAIEALTKALDLKSQTPHDPETKKKCEELLKKLNG